MHWNTFLVVGGVFFWLALGFELIVLTLFTARQNFAGATWTLVVFLLLLEFCGQVPFGRLTVEHFRALAAGVLAYFVLGGLASLWLWDRLVVKERPRVLMRAKLSYDNYVRSWSRETHKAEDPDFGEPLSWPAWWAANRDDLVPNPAEYHDTIVVWIAYWPFAILAWAFEDLLHDIVQAIARLLKGWYRDVARYHFRNFEQE